MPPKKGTAKAKTPVKAAAATDGPATITNARGKEIDTTAAAGRPRRATVVATPASAAKPAVKKAASKATTTKASATTAGKKRGRPAKAAEDDTVEPPKKRGRPSTASAKPVTGATKTAASSAKKPGRPAKKAADVPAVAPEEEAPPKARGRPPKGGETTKVEAEDDAIAEQLEGELDDAAKEEADEPRKQTSPVKKGKERPKKAAADDDELEKEQVVTGPQYWLMKAEQEDRQLTSEDGSTHNSKFTINDLREKTAPEPWDGVRNPTACKNMKEMKVGDLAFFYASGGKAGKTPGITGIMEIVKEAEADLGAFDKSDPYYVKNDKMRGSKDKPRWFMVHVEFRKKLSKPVSLKELQKYTQEGSILSKMQEFNAARLSVSKVTNKEWNFIVNNLIEGYEDEAPPTNSAGANGVVNGEVKGTESIKEMIESDAPNTDGVLSEDRAATSSRPASRAGSKKPASRAGSLAPRAASRGRSRTPRAASAQPTNTVDKMEVVQE